jgi:hypothetical protein
MAQGNTQEWLRALELIRNIGADYLVPGHGPVVGPESTHRVGEYIEFMRGRVRDFYRAGKNKNETKSGLVSEMLEWFPVPPERKAKIESQIKSGSESRLPRDSTRRRRGGGKSGGAGRRRRRGFRLDHGPQRRFAG